MRRHSKFTALLALGIVIGLVLSACQSAPAPSAKSEPGKPAVQAKAEPKEPYKIGMLVPLTGAAAQGGAEIRDAVNLEVERINASGGIDGHPIQVIIEDDGSDPTKAATGATKLIRQDNVLALGGIAIPTLDQAVKPIAEREQIAYVCGTTASQPVVDAKYKWGFNIGPYEAVQAAAQLDLIREKGYKKLVNINLNQPPMISQAKVVQTLGAKEGIEVIMMSDTFEFNTTDFTPQLTKLKDIVLREKPQAILSGASSVTLVPFHRALQTLGVDLPIIGHFGYAFSPILESSTGGEFDKTVFPTSKFLVAEQLPDSDPQKAVQVDYKQRFKAKYGRVADNPGGLGADPLNIIVQAIRVAGPDKGKIRDAIEKTTNFVGLTGIYTYTPSDHQGYVKGLGVLQVKDKQFKLVRVLK